MAFLYKVHVGFMICLIGNSGISHNLKDGQTSKVRLYAKKIIDEGYQLYFIDLEKFSIHPFLTLFRIKLALKKCDRIILITAKRGCKVLIPFINFLNRKVKKPFILPLIGSSVLHNSIDKLDVYNQNSFLLERNYSLCNKPTKLSKQLSKITIILPETDLLTKTFKDFYRIRNVYTLTNFREINITPRKSPLDFNKVIKLVFVSRVMEKKGIFDLLEAIKQVNKNKVYMSLDIYGKKYLDDREGELFNSYLNNSIVYKGVVNMESVIDTIAKYDLFVFPTRFVEEGAPGVVIESLLANTPILTSNFPQVYSLLKDGFDSMFFKMFDKENLKEKLMYIVNNRDFIERLRQGVYITSQKYTYEHERNLFLKYICGKNE